MDISAGGLSFHSLIPMEPGARLRAYIRFPGAGRTVTGLVEILRTTSGGVCSGRFLNLTSAMIDTIHRYVHSIQRQTISK